MLHLENNFRKNNKNNVIIEYKLGKIQTTKSKNT